MERFLAHISEDGAREQTVLEHLEGTADYAEGFASAFGAGPWGRLCGLAHDIGKYSSAFQRRLRGGPKTDHATAGAKELNQLGCPAAALCVAGHHGGLPDLLDLRDRLQKPVEPYGAFSSQVSLKRPPLPTYRHIDGRGFSDAFFVRMLYSCLVDADYLDTERFMKDGAVERGGYDDIPALWSRLYGRIAGWLENHDGSTLNGRRSAILRACLEGAQGPAGLYTLTVPTGGGKTAASLAFALRHAAKHSMRRVIYVIPYTSIIEQNAQVFRDQLGDANVVEHHSNYDFDADEQKGGRHHLAAENWDAPVIVTTNVQFFESLFAAKPGRCRKLHNIAGSVIIFDEAQMMPTPYLRPCVRAIGELCANYGCTAVLCTATQPTLESFFPDGMTARELCPDTGALYQAFRRTTLEDVGPLTDSALAERLSGLDEVLCIVSTRKQALAVYALLPPEGSFHLSTLMYPEHRAAVLGEIKRRLKDRLPCRVVSTSLIEAGVDVDFPTVFRARAGLDSILQAAGRCNREGKRSPKESVVYLFEPESRYTAHLPHSMELPAALAQRVMARFKDPSSPEAIRAYFTELYDTKGESLDMIAAVRALESGTFPFRTVAEKFRIIGDETRSILIPIENQAADVADSLRKGWRSRALLRKAGRFSVSVYTEHFKALDQAGALELLDGEIAVLSDLNLYNKVAGLPLAPEGGKGIMV